MTEREGTNEPGGSDEIAAAHDALLSGSAGIPARGGTDAERRHSAPDRGAEAREAPEHDDDVV